MKKILLFLSIVLVVTGFFVLTTPIQTSAADGLVPCGPENPCTFCHIFVLVNNVIKFLLVPCSLNDNFPFVPIIASLYIVIGGFWMVFKSTNETDYKKGKEMVFSVVIGMLIIFSSWAFLNTIFANMGIAVWTGLGTWWTITCN
ncbi:hypothetical protein BWK69_00050 [Candidatus Parcubacteria bacterium A4]|nr:MAG: hypothetical protein BWK69_00050 [Candidatus Parcubacteria bacterium A4]